MGAAPIALPRRADPKVTGWAAGRDPQASPLRSVRMVSGAMQFTRMRHLPGAGAHK